MIASGLLYVESDYENGFNKCLLGVVNKTEIYGLVRFWNKNLIAGQVISYSGNIQKKENSIVVDVKSFFILPFSIPEEGMVLPMYLTVHGTLLGGNKIVSDVWVSDSKSLEKFTTSLVVDPKQKLPAIGSMLCIHGSVVALENTDFSIKVESRDFCPRTQKDSPKTPEKRPAKKPKFVSIDM